MLTPHWCEDLGIGRCVIDERAGSRASGLLSRLADVDPALFLPPELALLASLCEGARRRSEAPGAPATVIESARSYSSSHCGEAGPLHGRLDSMMLIPSETRAQARLPASGARVVAACGHHLQLRGDLEEPAQFALIRTALAQFYEIHMAEALPRGRVTARSLDVPVCELLPASAADSLVTRRDGEGRPRALLRRLGRRTVLRSWDLLVDSDGALYVAREDRDSRGRPLLPPAYMDTSCYDPSVAIAVAVAESERSVVLRQLMDAILEAYDRYSDVGRELRLCEAEATRELLAREGRHTSGEIRAAESSNCAELSSLLQLREEENYRAEVAAEERLMADEGLLMAALREEREQREASDAAFAAAHCMDDGDSEACRAIESRRLRISSLGSLAVGALQNEVDDLYDMIDSAACDGVGAASMECNYLEGALRSAERDLARAQGVLDPEGAPPRYHMVIEPVIRLPVPPGSGGE